MQIRFCLSIYNVFMSRLSHICHVATTASLLLAFFLIPLVLIPTTSEIFEFNKIIILYLLASIIFFSETIRFLSQDRPTLLVPPFATTAALFLGALLLTTVTSIDPHVSIFGYYARFHGGLLSWIAYSTILLALVQQTPAFILSVIKISLLSGFLVSGWGILEHWGIDASYWVQDVRYRVFSTIGQPNWLAAYLAMLMPFLFSFYLQAKNRKILAGLLLASLTFYTCFIFTYSRGGNLGLAAALLTWLLLLGLKNLRLHKLRSALLSAGLATITLIFASGLTPALLGAPPHRTVENLQTGDQTARTRLIVWQGSLDIFLHHPLLGSGLETFGESFYQYRPVAMNEISDFDFLFNKAHNEYINYLATTGLVGTLAYLALIINVAFITLRRLKQTRSIWIIAATSSLGGYLVQNIFGFTVVPVALLFILNLALIATPTAHTLRWEWSPILDHLRRYSFLLLAPLLLSILMITNLWRADVAYMQGLSTASTDQAIQDFTLANHLNPSEPLYYAELALSYAQAASYLPDSPTAQYDATLAQRYSDQAIAISPHERTIWRIRAQTLSSLISVNPRYTTAALESFQKAILLAPTDPRVRTELAQFYLNHGQQDLALQTFDQALRLKPDFFDANIALARLYLQQGNKPLAQKYLEKAKHVSPHNSQVLTLSQELN